MIKEVEHLKELKVSTDAANLTAGSCAATTTHAPESHHFGKSIDPTALLSTIHHRWRLDEQNRNSLIIAKQAGSLYDNFVGFTEAFEEIGPRLNQTQQVWHTAKNRLSIGQGNLVARTDALKHWGVQSSKELPDALRHTATLQGESP